MSLIDKGRLSGRSGYTGPQVLGTANLKKGIEYSFSFGSSGRGWSPWSLFGLKGSRGGWKAGGSSGQSSFKYTPTIDETRRVVQVRPDGSRIQTTDEESGSREETTDEESGK